MTAHTPFAVPTAWPFGVQLGVVVDVADPESLARVQVTLLAGDPSRAAPIWARVAVPFAGPNKGAFLLPDVGDEVLVAFVAGDSGAPIVIGGLWNGGQKPPETLGANGNNGVDRWSLTGRNGTRIAIVEESKGQETIKVSTPAGVTGTFTDAGGGTIELKTRTTSVKLDTSGVTVNAPTEVKVTAGGSVSVQAAMATIKAPMVKLDAALVDCSCFLKCNVLLASAVVSSSYTPGAGNIW